MNSERCTIDLRLGPAQPMILNLESSPIELELAGSQIDLELNASPIDLNLTATPINLTLSGTGAQGPPGQPSEAIEVSEAGETISALKPIVIVDGSAFVADSSNVTYRGFVAGISVESAIVGSNIRIQTFGRISDPSWNWDVTKSLVFAGILALTQTPPDVSSQPIARVEASDTLFIQIQSLIERI